MDGGPKTANRFSLLTGAKAKSFDKQSKKETTCRSSSNIHGEVTKLPKGLKDSKPGVSITLGGEMADAKVEKQPLSKVAVKKDATAHDRSVTRGGAKGEVKEKKGGAGKGNWGHHDADAEAAGAEEASKDAAHAVADDLADAEKIAADKAAEDRKAAEAAQKTLKQYLEEKKAVEGVKELHIRKVETNLKGFSVLTKEIGASVQLAEEIKKPKQQTKKEEPVPVAKAGKGKGKVEPEQPKETKKAKDKGVKASSTLLTNMFVVGGDRGGRGGGGRRGGRGGRDEEGGRGRGRGGRFGGRRDDTPAAETSEEAAAEKAPEATATADWDTAITTATETPTADWGAAPAEPTADAAPAGGRGGRGRGDRGGRGRGDRGGRGRDGGRGREGGRGDFGGRGGRGGDFRGGRGGAPRGGGRGGRWEDTAPSVSDAVAFPALGQ